MGNKQEITVEIRRHIMYIDSQLYQLRNIARVQNLELKPDRTRIFRTLAARGLAIIALLVVLNVMLDSESIATLNGLGFLVLAGLVIYHISVAVRRPWYFLLLETTGTPFAVLFSKQSSVIDQLVHMIGGALENPPTAPQVMHIGDVVMGDVLKMIGDRNIGKLVEG